MKTIAQNARSRSRRREKADTAMGMESRLQPAARSWAGERDGSPHSDLSRLTPLATLTLPVTYGNPR
jgi:hypothetical protein